MTTLFHWGAISIIASTLGFFNTSLDETPIIIEPVVIEIEADMPVVAFECPSDITVEITENACSIFVDLTAPGIPEGGAFPFSHMEATYTFNGIQVNEAFLAPGLTFPPEETLDVSPEGTTSVELWGGENVISYVSYNSEGVEDMCSYTITVVDGFAPVWPDGILEYEFEGRCGIDEAIDDIWFNLEIIFPEDNCCNAKTTIPEVTDTTTICGGAISVTFYVLGWDGSGDGAGNGDDSPCSLGGSADPHFSDTLWVTVHLIDTMPPTISGAPADETIACDATPDMPSLTATDVCYGDLTSSIEINIIDESNVECGNGAVNRFIEYQATVNDECGNSARETWKVFFENMGNFVVDLGEDLLLCNESMHTLDAGAGADSYTWSTAETSHEITVDASGWYSVTVTLDDCCTIDSIFLSFGADVVLNATGGTVTCTEPSVVLNAGVTTDEYAWTGPAGFMSNEQNPVVTEVGEYIIEATSSEGCAGKDTVMVTIDTIRPNITTTLDTVDCEAQRIRIIAGSSTPDVTFNWTGPGGFSSNMQDTSVRLAGEYTLTVLAPNGCESAQILDNPNTISTPKAKVTIKPATNGFDGVAEVSITNGVPPYVIDWSTSEVSDTIRDLEIGDYDVTITDANGCMDVASFEMVPQITVCDLPSTLISTNTTIIDTLRVLKLVTPSLLDAMCIKDEYGDPATEPVLGRTFLYQHVEGQNTTALKLDAIDNIKAFIFTCETFDRHSEQSCIGVSDAMGDFVFEDVSNTYYIVIAGTTSDEYNLVINEEGPTTPCDVVSGEVRCDVPSTTTLAGVSNFNSESGVYNGCYRGLKGRFLGPEKVYKFETDRPIDAMISVTSDKAVGVFIYNYLCSSQCISAFEVSEGFTTDDEIRLNTGLYFIVIDQVEEGDLNTQVMLNITCDDLSDAYWPPRRTADDDCLFSEANHRVVLPPGSIKLHPSIADSTESVWIHFLSPDKKTQIGEERRVIIGHEVVLRAYGDSIIAGDLDTCGYVETEKITYAMRTDDNLFLRGDPSYAIGPATYKPKGNSLMGNLQGASPVLASLQPVEIKDIPADTNLVEFTIQSNEGQEWEILNWDVPWITSVELENPVGTSNRIGVGTQKVTVILNENLDMEERPAVIFIDFGEGIPNRRIDLIQQGFVVSGLDYIADLPGMKIFPNPSSGLIYVDFSDVNYGSADIRVVNVNGTIIKSIKAPNIQNEQFELNLNNNPPGIYFIQVIQENRSVVRKIVLNPGS